MLEKDLERKLYNRVKKRGGLCIKLVGYNGIPDRLIVMPGGHVGFVELKRPDGKGRLTEIQKLWQRDLKELGCFATVFSDKDGIDQLLDEIICFEPPLK